MLVHDFLSRTASDMPERAAVVGGESSRTFRELDEASGRLAAAL